MSKRIKKWVYVLEGMLVFGALTLLYINNASDSSKKADSDNIVHSDKGGYIYEKKDLDPVDFSDVDSGELYLRGGEGPYAIRSGKIYVDSKEVEDIDAEKKDRLWRLAIFYQWSKEDPLFFSATLDAEEFQKSVSRLDEEQKKILRQTGWKDSIYPVPFLEAFASASRSYVDLERRVSEENAEKLLDSSKKARSDYAEDVKKLFAVVGEQARQNPDLKYIGQNGETTSTSRIIAEDIGMILRNAEEAEIQLGKRERCLKESLDFCQLPEIKPANRAEGDDMIDQSGRNEVMSFSDLGINDPSAVMGPFEVESRCWGGSSEQLLYVDRRCFPNFDMCAENSYLATNRYFVTKLNEQRPFEKHLIDLGIGAIPQSSTSPYLCNNIEHKPLLQSMANFWEKYFSERIFSKNDPALSAIGPENKLSQIIDMGRQAENNFFDAAVPAEKDWEELGFIYRNMYENIAASETEDLKGKKEELLLRANIIREKMTGIVPVLNRITFHFASVVLSNAAAGGDNPSVSPQYIYPIRSHYSVTYLNFSPSVWRLSEKPRYMVPNESVGFGGGASIVDMETAQEIFGKENLLRWEEEYKGIIRSQFNQDFVESNFTSR